MNNFMPSCHLYGKGNTFVQQTLETQYYINGSYFPFFFFFNCCQIHCFPWDLLVWVGSRTHNKAIVT